MALADLKKFYKELEKSHIERRVLLEQAATIAAEGGMPQEKIDQLKSIYQSYDEKYQFATYMLWLLALPKRNEKKVKMLTKDEKLIIKFSEFGLDEDSIKADNEEVLNNFREYIKNLKEE